MNSDGLDGLVSFALGSAAFILLLAALFWRRREMPGAVPLTSQAILISGLCVAIAAESAATGADAQLWFLARDALILPSGILILWFALEYASFRRYLSRPLITALVGSMLLHFVLYIPDGGRLLWSRLWWDGEVRGELAPIGALFTAYALVLFVLATLILVVLFVRSPAHRVPVGLILAGHIVVRVVYPLTALKIAELPNEANVLALNFAALMYAIALLRFRMFELVPVARQTIIERMGDAIFVLDTRDRIADLNAAARRLFGLQHGKLVGKPIGQAGSDPRLLATLAAAGPPSDVTLKTTDGERATEVSTTELTDWQGAAIGRLVQVHDITDLRAAEHRLVEQERALAAALERERLARDLHDSLGQVLGYVGLQAATMRKLMLDGRLDEVEERLDRLGAIATDAQSDVRRTIAELARSSPSSTDFIPSLRSRLAACERDYGIDTSLEVSRAVDDLKVTPAVAGQLLRIVDEAVSNAIRHGRASAVRVLVDCDASSLTLAVEDDGSGFDDARQPRDEVGRYGLRFMRERAVELGGVLEIRSVPGDGTTVTIRVPHEARPGVAST